MVDKILGRVHLLDGAAEEIKVLYLYRYISLILTSFFYLIGNSQSSTARKLIVIMLLSMASVTLSYLYIKNQKDRNIVKVLIILETIGNTLILIPTGGLNSPYIWYSLNTVLVSVYYFSIIYCLLNLSIYIAFSTEITHMLFVKNHNFTDITQGIWNNSNLMLSFILITVAVQLLLTTTKKLNIERKNITEVNNQLVEANERTKESVEYIMSLYQTVYSFINLRNRSKLLSIIIYYTKKITKAPSAFFYMPSDTEDNELKISEDISENYKSVLVECIKKQFDSIKCSDRPIKLNIMGRVFSLVVVKSTRKVYGVIGIEVNKGSKNLLFEETMGQLQFLSSLSSFALERFELEEISKNLMITEEQNRIAREIHDSVCQRIFATNCMIQTLKQKIDKVPLDEAKKEFDFIIQSLNKANKELRITIYDLSWKNNQSISFREIVEGYIRDISKLNDVNITFNMEGNQKLINSSLNKALYRIISESIGNSVRHGMCRNIEILLDLNKEDLKLTIRDDGKGFDFNNNVKDKKTGLGLQNIYGLVYTFGGEINIDSTPGKGTSINIVLPNNILKDKAEGEVV